MASVKITNFRFSLKNDDDINFLGIFFFGNKRQQMTAQFKKNGQYIHITIQPGKQPVLITCMIALLVKSVFP